MRVFLLIECFTTNCNAPLNREKKDDSMSYVLPSTPAKPCLGFAVCILAFTKSCYYKDLVK